MAKLRVPPAQSDIQSMRNFYQSIGSMQQYKHCHEVYRKAAKAGIVEESVIRDNKEDPERRWANVTLRRIALSHSLDYSKLRSSEVALPRAVRDERVLEELEIFNRLTELERTGAPIESYSNLLNNGRKPPLALLVKLADYAVTHDTENQLEGFIDDGRASMIRRYQSIDEAYRAMKMDALAGEKLYAPVAELFGYPLLAGDIFLHSFRVNHPEIYTHVFSSMSDPLMNQRMEMTQHLGSEFAKVISGILKSYEFDAEVTLRKEKHDGKKMNKTLRLLKEDFAKTEEGCDLLAKIQTAKLDASREGTLMYEALEDAYSAAITKYIYENIRSFDFERFNDWVAVRAVIHRFRGRNIDEILDEAGGGVNGGHQNGRAEGTPISQISELLDKVQSVPLRIAVRSISNAIMSLGDLYSDFLGKTDSKVAYYDKTNGYRAFHFDSRSEKGAGPRSLPFEVQLKTAKWHALAEQGEAAHVLYLGGDKAFVDMLRTSYHDIMNPPEPRSRPGLAGSLSRRSSRLLPLIETK